MQAQIAYLCKNHLEKSHSLDKLWLRAQDASENAHVRYANLLGCTNAHLHMQYYFEPLFSPYTIPITPS